MTGKFKVVGLIKNKFLLKSNINIKIIIFICLITKGSRGSSVSIVSGYGLDDPAIEVRYLAEARKRFSSNLCVQTGSWVHTAFCVMGTGGPFPGHKVQPGRDADHSPPSSAEVVNE
jgi:hypothetical protein